MEDKKLDDILAQLTDRLHTLHPYLDISYSAGEFHLGVLAAVAIPAEDIDAKELTAALIRLRKGLCAVLKHAEGVVKGWKK